MSKTVTNIRNRLETIATKLRLLPAARLLSEPFRRWNRHQQFLQFKRRYGNVLRYRLNALKQEGKRALVFNFWNPAGDVSLGLTKSLELAGFEPIVLLRHEERHFLEYYKLAAIKEVAFWNESIEPADLAAAKKIVAQFQSIDELFSYEYAGARVGKYAVSTALRRLRLPNLDLQSAQDRQILEKYLGSSIAAVNEAQRILLKFQPDLLLIIDPVYTPAGELFDVFIANDIATIIVEPGHKSNTLLIKRYTSATRDEHPASLSSETWQLLYEMEWTNVHREQLEKELKSSYASGDWYPVVWGKSSNEHLLGDDEIRTRLGLDQSKKTAFIFPHIVWDASFSWGKNLFDSYEEWFIKAVEAACMNDQVNWVIKIHPANVGKSELDGFRGEAAEVVALRKHIDRLPPHVFLIPADSDISTFSLYGLMDYCLTVRGTVGIEAARLGIPVLTAGTGRYDRRGFTIDSDSCEEYLNKLARIQEIPRLSPAQRELAERFAYGIFVLRILPLQSVILEYRNGGILKKGFTEAKINIKTKDEWYSAPDLRAISQWLNRLNQTDFISSPPMYQIAERVQQGVLRSPT